MPDQLLFILTARKKHKAGINTMTRVLVHSAVKRWRGSDRFCCNLAMHRSGTSLLWTCGLGVGRTGVPGPIVKAGESKSVEGKHSRVEALGLTNTW